MADDDVSLMIGLLRMVQREMAAGFESVREEQKRCREAIDRLVLDHEDNAQRIAVLEHSAKRRIGVKK